MKKCQDVMRIDLKVVSSAATAFEAARTMRDNSVGFLPMCDPETGRLVGVITDRDLVTRMSANDLRPSETRVAEIATRAPAVCRSADSLTTAEKMMMSLDISRVVIVDEDAHPVGVVSLTDIIMGRRARRALRTARGVLEREAAGPQPPIESIVLTPSDPIPPQGSEPSGEEFSRESGTAMSRRDAIIGGRETSGMKEFPH